MNIDPRREDVTWKIRGISLRASHNDRRLLLSRFSRHADAASNNRDKSAVKSPLLAPMRYLWRNHASLQGVAFIPSVDRFRWMDFESQSGGSILSASSGIIEWECNSPPSRLAFAGLCLRV